MLPGEMSLMLSRQYNLTRPPDGARLADGEVLALVEVRTFAQDARRDEDQQLVLVVRVAGLLE